MLQHGLMKCCISTISSAGCYSGCNTANYMQSLMYIQPKLCLCFFADQCLYHTLDHDTVLPLPNVCVFFLIHAYNSFLVSAFSCQCWPVQLPCYWSAFITVAHHISCLAHSWSVYAGHGYIILGHSEYHISGPVFVSHFLDNGHITIMTNASLIRICVTFLPVYSSKSVQN